MKILRKDIPFITLFAAFIPMLQSMELSFEERVALIETEKLPTTGSPDVLEIHRKAELPTTLVQKDNAKDGRVHTHRVSHGFNVLEDTFRLPDGNKITTVSTMQGIFLYEWTH